MQLYVANLDRPTAEVQFRTPARPQVTPLHVRIAFGAQRLVWDDTAPYGGTRYRDPTMQAPVAAVADVLASRPDMTKASDAIASGRLYGLIYSTTGPIDMAAVTAACAAQGTSELAIQIAREAHRDAMIASGDMVA